MAIRIVVLTSCPATAGEVIAGLLAEACSIARECGEDPAGMLRSAADMIGRADAAQTAPPATSDYQPEHEIRFPSEGGAS